jgi:UDP-N-acetylmuramate--alanine ligase
MDAFGPALKDADEIVVTEIYAAGEDPIPGVTVDALADSIKRGSGRPVRIVRQLDELVSELVTLAQPGDAVITLGAGSIGTLPKRLIEALGKRGAPK